MKTDKLLHLMQQKRAMRSGGALPLPKAQKGIVNQNAYDLWYKYNTPEGRTGIPEVYSSYDYKKYFEDAVTGVNPMGFDEESMHFPDTYKYPWHPSFSDESIYYVNQKETPALSYQTKQAGGLAKAQVGTPDIQSLLNEYSTIQSEINKGYQDDYVNKLREVADKAVKEKFVFEKSGKVPESILNWKDPKTGRPAYFCIGTSCYLANQAGDPFFHYSNTEAEKAAMGSDSTRYLEQDEKYIEPGDIIQFKRNLSEKAGPEHAYTILDIGKSSEKGFRPIKVVGSKGSGAVEYRNYYLGPDNKIYSSPNDIPMATQLLKRKHADKDKYNEIISRRDELKQAIEAIQPDYFNPKSTVRSGDFMPTDFLFNRSGWYGGNPENYSYDTKDRETTYALGPAGENRFAEQIYAKESKLPEILSKISDPSYKKEFMQKHNINSREYDAIAKNMLGIYGAETKFNTDYWGKTIPEPQGLSKLLGIGSVGPFQINRKSLSKDLRKKYSKEDLYNPEKAAEATMEFLAEGLTGKGMNLRSRAKKEKDSPMYMENVNPENYLDYLSYLHNQPGWLTGDVKTKQLYGDVVAGEHPYKKLVDYYLGLFDVLPSSISTPVDIVGEKPAYEWKKTGGLTKAQAGTAYVESLCGPGYIESVDENGNKVCIDPATQQRPDIGYNLREQYKNEPTVVSAGYNGPYDGIADYYSRISTPLESNFSGYCPECKENERVRRSFNFPKLGLGDLFKARPNYSRTPKFRKKNCVGIDCFKFEDGGDNTPAVNTAVAPPVIQPLAAVQDIPPYVDQKVMEDPFVRIVDTRKIHPVSGNPIRPNADLKTGKYQKKIIDKLIKEAKKYDFPKEDVINNLTISLQETGLGNLDNALGHALHGDYISGRIEDKEVLPPLSDEEVAMYEEDPYLKGARLQLMNYKYNTSVLNKPAKDLETRLQHYNTPYPKKGQLRADTELDKYGKPNKMWYGTDVTKQPLSTSGNPYGKTVASLRPFIADNPMIQYMLYKEGYKQKGGPKMNPYLPNTPLATGAVESVMGPIDYALLPSKLPLAAASALGRGAITLAEILNPLGGLRPSADMMYRGIGKEGFKDAVESGVIRPKQYNYPSKRSIKEIVNSPKQFDKTYYTPDAKVAMEYGEGYVTVVPNTAADFAKRYGKKDWSWSTGTQIPLNEAAIYQKYPVVGYKKKFRFQDAGELSLQYVPNGTYGNYYDPATQQYISQVYKPEVQIAASRNLAEQYVNGEPVYAPHLAARGTAEYVPAESVLLPGTPVVKGLGKVGNVLLDVANPLSGMGKTSIVKAASPNPIAIADEILPALDPIKMMGIEGSILDLSPLNLIPGYGKSLKGYSKAYRKFGNTMEDVIERQALSPKGGSPLRMGKDQIVSEGNWAALKQPSENYSGTYAAEVDFNKPGTNIGYDSFSNRNGVLLTDASHNKLIEIPITDPGLQFHRRLPFSTRYVPIDKQKLIDKKFQLATQGGYLQSLLEKYGMGLGAAATLEGIGREGTIDQYNKYTADPIINWATEQYLNFNSDKKTGGLTSSKAKEILHDKSVHGKPLTDKQRRFFGAIASGNKIRVKLNK